MTMSRLLEALPEVFSLRGDDYSRFVVRGGAAQMMRDTWAGVGSHMHGAVAKVGGQALERKKKDHANAAPRSKAGAA